MWKISFFHWRLKILSGGFNSYQCLVEISLLSEIYVIRQHIIINASYDFFSLFHENHIEYIL